MKKNNKVEADINNLLTNLLSQIRWTGYTNTEERGEKNKNKNLHDPICLLLLKKKM